MTKSARENQEQIKQYQFSITAGVYKKLEKITHGQSSSAIIWRTFLKFLESEESAPVNEDELIKQYQIPLTVGMYEEIVKRTGGKTTQEALQRAILQLIQINEIKPKVKK